MLFAVDILYRREWPRVKVKCIQDRLQAVLPNPSDLPHIGFKRNKPPEPEVVTAQEETEVPIIMLQKTVIQ
jgi:hypothetical protein